MVVVPLPKDSQYDSTTAPWKQRSCPSKLVGLAASGSLIAGAVLLLTGRRRSGLVAAVSGATLTALDQQETIRSWWQALPGYLDQTQRILGEVQDTVNEVAVRRQRLERVLHR